MDIEKVEGYIIRKQCQGVRKCNWCCCYYPESSFTEDIDGESCDDCERFRQSHDNDLGCFFLKFINGQRFRVFVSADEDIFDSMIDQKIKRDYFRKTIK